jgi:hypothetical protein
VETHFVVRSHGNDEQRNAFRVLSGRYLDLFEQRNDEWRILNRTTMYDCAGSSEATPLAFQHIEGSRSHDDPSYHIFEAVNGRLPQRDEVV